MEIIKINVKLTAEEREIHLNLDAVSRIWTMDTTILKYYNKALKQGWKMLKQYVYDDGSIAGGLFEAPERSITVRNTEKKVMSEKQLGNLLDDDE